MRSMRWKMKFWLSNESCKWAPQFQTELDLLIRPTHLKKQTSMAFSTISPLEMSSQGSGLGRKKIPKTYEREETDTSLRRKWSNSSMRSRWRHRQKTSRPKLRKHKLWPRKQGNKDWRVPRIDLTLDSHRSCRSLEMKSHRETPTDQCLDTISSRMLCLTRSNLRLHSHRTALFSQQSLPFKRK